MKATFVRFVLKSVLVLALGSFSARAQVIVDDGDPGFSASTSWPYVVGAGYGGDFHYRSTAPVSDPATWKAELPWAHIGPTSVYAWWPIHLNNSPSAPYVIYHGSGSTTVYVNQQVNGGKWNLLGSWTMSSGLVKLSPWTGPGYIVVADAIKWQ